MCSLFCFKDQTSFFEFTPLYGLYQRIKDCNGVYRYLCQAFEYWELNANFYFNNENTKEYYCKFDSGCLPDKITKEYNNLLDKL